MLRRCAPDQRHKHIDFDDFDESAPPPSLELSEIYDFRAFAMAAEENTQMLKFIGGRGVRRASGC